VGDKTPPDLQGFLIPSAQFSATNLVAKDDSTTPSTYTQAGNRTGVPKAAADSGMVLQGSGTQDEDGHLEIVCQRAGLPGLDRGGFVFRDEAAGDTTSEFYGADGPQLVTGWHGLDFETSGRVATLWPDMVRLDNGTLLAVYGFNSSTRQWLFASLDPSTGAWTKSGVQIDGQDWTSAAVSIVQMPRASGDANGELLLYFDNRGETQINVARSSDLGATWEIAGRSVLGKDVGGAIVNIRARHNGGQTLLLAQWTDSGSETIAQFASVDGRGVSFAQIDASFLASTSPAEEAELPNIVRANGPGFLVSTHDPDSTIPRVNYRQIASASQKISATTKTSSNVNAALPAFTPGSSMFRDDAGIVYSYQLAADVTDGIALIRSEDGGSTWSTWQFPLTFTTWDTGSAGTPEVYLHTFAAEAVAGRVFMLTRWADNGGSSFDSWSIGVIEFGGYSRHTAPARQDSTSFASYEYASFADNLASQLPGGLDLPGNVYLPLDLPGNIGDSWTKAGAGAEAIAVNGSLALTPGGSAIYYSRDRDTAASGGNPAAKMVWAEIHVRTTSGSPGFASGTEVGIDLRLTDGNSGSPSTYSYAVSVRLLNDGYRVFDENASPTQVGSVTSGFTLNGSTFVALRVFLSEDGKVFTTHANGGADTYRKFVAGVTATGLTDGGVVGSTSRVRFGSLIANSTVSQWEMVGWNAWCNRSASQASDSAAAGFTNPTHLLGASFPTEFALVKAGARVRAIDGPAYLGDTWDVIARYDHPVSFAFQDVDPSPRRLWRSTSDNSAIDLVVNLDATSGKSRTLGESIGIFVRGANFPTFTLSRWNGSAWVTVGTATGKIGPLAWRRNGEFVELDTGTTATISQFVRWGDFDGGTMKLDGSPAVYRKVERHTSGAWSSGTASRPVFQLADTKASDPTAGTEGELWTTDYGVVVHDHGNGSGSNIYRIQIPASQTAVDYYTGKFIVGGVHPFGWPHDRNWSMREEHDVDLVTRPGGMRTATKRGPPRRALEVTWVQTSIDETLIRKALTASALPDYVAANANPSATRHSTISDVMGTLRIQSGPKDPVIFIRQIAPGQASQQYTTKDLWIHGRVETTDPQMDNVVGREATNPLGKLNTILIVEEV
jgi:hypothetical protein